MNPEDLNLWLKKLINTDKFDAWLAVSFLYRYPTVGIHEYICKKLKHTKNLIIVIPQLVHIFLYHSDSEISKPICNLMKYRATKSRKFFLSLYFYLKGAIETIDSNKSIHCYFLICDILKLEGRYLSRNTEFIKLQLKYKRRLHRTPRVIKEKKCMPNFDGIFLCFLRSVMWVCDLKIFKMIKNYETVFQQARNVAKINFKPVMDTGNAFKHTSIKSSIMFIEYLVEISYRLKKLPKNLRQKGLEMELKLLNCNLPGKISLPFFKSQYVLSIRIEYSTTLSSAENTPYIVLLEIADETLPKKRIDAKNAALLMQQLNAVSGFTYISDSKNINDNYAASLQKILEAERIITDSECENDTEKMQKKITKWKKRRYRLNSDIKSSLSNEIVKLDSLKLNENCKPANLDANLIKKEYLNPMIDISSVFFENEDPITKTENGDDLISESDLSSVDEWQMRNNLVKTISRYGNLRGWRLVSLIVKTGCSLKQEIIAYQILLEMQQIWKDESKDIWVKPYQIYFVNNNAGLVETVENAYSIHKIKETGKQENRNFSLKTYFLDKFGDGTDAYKQATYNFLISLVGYSLACYILQIKDRHNGNILLDTEGHIIHVDFGFILGDHPGFYCVEVAPFKFCSEYEELLKDLLEDFKILFLEGFCALRKHSERLCRILEMLSENSDIRCVNKKVLNSFKDRLKLEMSDKELESYVLFLINKSFNSMGTGLYDSYQYFSNGYL